MRLSSIHLPKDSHVRGPQRELVILQKFFHEFWGKPSFRAGILLIRAKACSQFCIVEGFLVGAQFNLNGLKMMRSQKGQDVVFAQHPLTDLFANGKSLKLERFSCFVTQQDALAENWARLLLQKYHGGIEFCLVSR